jgi:hypothetical protein
VGTEEGGMTTVLAILALGLASYAAISIIMAKREKRRRDRQFIENLTTHLFANRR